MLVRRRVIDVFAILDADEIGNFRRIERAAIPAREQPGCGGGAKERADLPGACRLERFVDVVFDPRRSPGAPHRHWRRVAGELDRRCSPPPHSESSNRRGCFVRRRAAQTSVPSGIRRVWHDAQFASPSATPFDVGIQRRSGSVPSARGFTGDFANPCGLRANAMTWGSRTRNARDVELVEYALAGPNPVGVARQRGRLDQRLGTDRLQHLPVACRLTPRVINGVGAKVIDGRLVIFLGGKMPRPHVEPGDRRCPFA